MYQIGDTIDIRRMILALQKQEYQRTMQLKMVLETLVNRNTQEAIQKSKK